MPDVLVRPWSEKCYAAYLDLGLAHPVFVGCEATADEAREWGRRVLADEDGSLENRCGVSVPAACVASPETSDMGELGCVQRERATAPRRTTRTPAGDRSLL